MATSANASSGHNETPPAVPVSTITGEKPRVSVIVPTYCEAENLPSLIGAIETVASVHSIPLEVLIMDDDSPDNTQAVVQAINKPWVRLIVRKDTRDLSRAVLDGFSHAHGEIFVVMDADLSHPPEAIPALLHALEEGADFAVGSRYVPGGSVEEGWGLFPWINSKIATCLARPFTRIKDPMSGFFAVRRVTVEQAAPLNPIGYKIGLELIVKCRCRRVAEIPIHFRKRVLGHSKLNLREQVRYLRHVCRLACFTWFSKK